MPLSLFVASQEGALYLVLLRHVFIFDIDFFWSAGTVWNLGSLTRD